MLSRIRERKLVQWLVAYAAAVFVLLQVLDPVVQAYPAFSSLLQVAITLAIMGVPVVLVVGWYHGEKGRQRVTVTEAVLLVLLVVLTGFALRRVTFASAAEPASVLENASTPLDTLRYAVLPFRHGQDVPEVNEDLLLHDALASWRGISVVEQFHVREAVARGGMTTPRQRGAAEALGAGRLVTGDLTRVGFTIRLHATLVDTRTGASLSQARAQYPLNGGLADTAADRIAATLLFDPADPEMNPDADRGTTSYSARMAFLEGRRAAREWRLAEADSMFASALEADPDYTRALLWRAYVQSWADRDPAALPGLAFAVHLQRASLSPRERLLSDALSAMSVGDFPAACAAYDALRSRDDTDFAAWFGLGECRYRDDVVVRDAGSPSGWAYRGSAHASVEAYRRAFELRPSVHRGFGARSFTFISDRLRLSSNALRRGRAAPPDTITFLGWAAWVADSLAFTPYPAARVSAGAVEPDVKSRLAALNRQRGVFLEIIQSWASAYPTSPEAMEALALGQEMVGDPRALGTLTQARALSEDPGQSLRIAEEQVKLLAKSGDPAQLEAARLLSDSILSRVGDNARDDAESLAAIAALTGRTADAAEWARKAAQPVDWGASLPRGVKAPADALLIYAALGEPEDSIRAYEAELDAALANRMSAEDRARAERWLLDRSASLAFPAHPLAATPRLAARTGYTVLRAEGALAAGRIGEARRFLTNRREERRDIPPSQLTFDAVFPEAWLWLAVGDTTSAVNLLDATLNALRWTEPGSLGEAAQAGALVRAMALRADVAAALDDAPTASRWAEAVVRLWADADEPLQPTVRRMRSLVDSRRGSVAPATSSLPRR